MFHSFSYSSPIDLTSPPTGAPANATGNSIKKVQGVEAPNDTWLNVVYTNNVHTLKGVLDMYAGWLATAKQKFVGLDLEYTPDLNPHTKRHTVTLVQIAMYKHVLLFH